MKTPWKDFKWGKLRNGGGWGREREGGVEGEMDLGELLQTCNKKTRNHGKCFERIWKIWQCVTGGTRGGAGGEYGDYDHEDLAGAEIFNSAAEKKVKDDIEMDACIAISVSL